MSFNAESYEAGYEDGKAVHGPIEYERGYAEALTAAKRAEKAEGDPVSRVVGSVATLTTAMPGLLAECTDPNATDMAELLATVREAREALQSLEREVETACAKAMLDDQALTPTLRVERYRSTDRKKWDHEQWQRDVRAKAMQALGLKGSQGVLTADGEVLPASVLHELLTSVEAAHSAAAPKTTALRALGLDARDYCESSPGAWHVKVLRMADENEQAGAA